MRIGELVEALGSGSTEVQPVLSPAKLYQIGAWLPKPAGSIGAAVL
ncbi:MULTISPECIES: hypothetical protein [Sinorhizobium]|nr:MULTISPECIES: hypothetical protein [Sinorhizobium]